MHDLRFLADMNISPETVFLLRQEGWNIDRVSDLMGPSATDTEILEYARSNSMVVITQDLDFSMLLAVGGYVSPSVVNIRIEYATPQSVVDRLLAVAPALAKELRKGTVITIDETTARHRGLPIGRE